jgi:hypothetical protein
MVARTGKDLSDRGSAIGNIARIARQKMGPALRPRPVVPSSPLANTGCMKSIALLLMAASLAGLAACVHIDPAPSTAEMPPGALGTNGDIDVRSLDVAAYAFAHVIRNDPAGAADAMAALDYMGGELNTNPRWIGMDPLTRSQMLQARETLRAYIGISQAASSQAVVDTMLSLSQAYRAGDTAAVQSLLANPIFIVPPAEAQAHLSYIPLMPAINNVTTRADELLPDAGSNPS